MLRREHFLGRVVFVEGPLEAAWKLMLTLALSLNPLGGDEHYIISSFPSFFFQPYPHQWSPGAEGDMSVEEKQESIRFLQD